MIRKYLLPLLALAGVVAAIVVVLLGGKASRSSEPEVPVVRAPYASYIAGAGLIEASTGNNAGGTPVAGVVGAGYVRWCARVSARGPRVQSENRDMAAPP